MAVHGRRYIGKQYLSQAGCRGDISGSAFMCGPCLVGYIQYVALLFATICSNK